MTEATRRDPGDRARSARPWSMKAKLCGFDGMSCFRLSLVALSLRYRLAQPPQAFPLVHRGRVTAIGGQPRSIAVEAGLESAVRSHRKRDESSTRRTRVGLSNYRARP